MLTVGWRRLKKVAQIEGYSAPKLEGGGGNGDRLDLAKILKKFGVSIQSSYNGKAHLTL